MLNGALGTNGISQTNGLVSPNGFDTTNGLGAINGKAGSDAEGFLPSRGRTQLECSSRPRKRSLWHKLSALT